MARPRSTKPAKTAECRAAECARIVEQLDELGLPDEAAQSVKDVLRAFVADGHGRTETVKLKDLGLAVLVQLSTRPGAASFARVRRVAPATVVDAP